MPLVLVLMKFVQKRLRDWRLSIFLLAFISISGWIAMRIAEPGNPLVAISNYHYYFVTTMTTIGYGDLSPKTALGKIIGDYVEIGAAGTGALIFAQLITLVNDLASKHRRGLGTMDAENHLVVLGYVPDRTQVIIERAIGHGVAVDVALCAPESVVDENPLSEVKGVQFVRGALSSEATHAQAKLGLAKVCIIDADSDFEAFGIASIVREQFPTIRLVVPVRDLDHMRRFFDAVDGPPVELVPWSDTETLVDSVCSPGLNDWTNDLKRPDGQINSEVLTVPAKLDGWTVEQILIKWGRSDGMAVLYVVPKTGDQINGPKWGVVLRTGDLVGYTAEKPLVFN